MNILDDYSILKKDKEGLWSLTHKIHADQISEIIFNILGYDKTILDATAGVGGNTISFCKYFKNVIAIEKNNNRCKMLYENTSAFNVTNLTIINDTCINYLNNNYDAIFFDPPWGGIDYKKSKHISLFIDNQSLKDIILSIKNNNNNKLCIFKLPYNYNMKEFIDYDYKIYSIHNYIIIII
jgi:16S rRNA A1518/A1519 N6-dimethyltransferase RsmA/KsgA/DIM1 with predicted DNA glycosylase/AP lyase activity